MKSLFELISKETWERTIYFLRIKELKEGFKPLNKSDILPLALSTLIVFGFVIVVLMITILIQKLFQAL